MPSSRSSTSFCVLAIAITVLFVGNLLVAVDQRYALRTILFARHEAPHVSQGFPQGDIGIVLRNRMRSPSQRLPIHPAGFVPGRSVFQSHVSEVIPTSRIRRGYVELQGDSLKNGKPIDAQEATGQNSLPTPSVSSATIVGSVNTSSASSSSSSTPVNITTDDPLVLTGDTILRLRGSDHYVVNNNIVLEDNAQLIVEDGATFEQHQDYSGQYTLEARDNARIEVRDATLIVDIWINWNFRENTTYVLDNVEDDDARQWHSFSDSASGTALGSNFRGSIYGSASLDIQNSPLTYIELVYPTGATVDDTLPTGSVISDMSIPDGLDSGVNFHVRVRNSTAISWGVTVAPQNNIIIRNAGALTVTIAVGNPWTGQAVELSDLDTTLYSDTTWTIVDSTLRLVNVTTLPWSPIAGNNNTLTLRNSHLADNAYSWGTARIYIINSSASYVRARQNVEITLSGSTVSGDVVAQDNGIVHIINSTVGGQTIQQGAGQILYTLQHFMHVAMDTARRWLL